MLYVQLIVVFIQNLQKTHAENSKFIFYRDSAVLFLMCNQIRRKKLLLDD